MEGVHDNLKTPSEKGGQGEDAQSGVGQTNSEEITAPKRRLGFMKGQYTVPDDFDTMLSEEIEGMFYGSDLDREGDDLETIADEEPPAKSQDLVQAAANRVIYYCPRMV
jgi:hypothetical protein